MNFFSYNNCFLICVKHHMVTYFLRETLKLYANYDSFRRITQMSPNHKNKPRVIMDSSTIFKLLLMRHICFDLVIRFITKRKYDFFCIF